MARWIEKLICFIICSFIFSLPFSLLQPGQSQDEDGYYATDKCTSNANCSKNCGEIPGLKPRCDRNGTCICDCSNMTLWNSYPQPPPNCQGWIPSHEFDSCSKYCTAEYQRSGRICGIIVGPGQYIYCTGLCQS